MKRAVFMLTLLCMVSIAFAQRVSLTAREQASLKEQAVKKVKSFQESCKTIADSDIPFYKKTSKDGYIDVTMLDFMDGCPDSYNKSGRKKLYGKSGQAIPKETGVVVEPCIQGSAYFFV